MSGRDKEPTGWTVLVAFFLVGLLAGLVGFEVRARDAASVLEAGRSAKQQKIDFGREIKPLLAEYCYGCHGEKKKGGLDFRIYRDESSALEARRDKTRDLKQAMMQELLTGRTRFERLENAVA